MPTSTYSKPRGGGPIAFIGKRIYWYRLWTGKSACCTGGGEGRKEGRELLLLLCLALAPPPLHHHSHHHSLTGPIAPSPPSLAYHPFSSTPPCRHLHAQLVGADLVQ